MKELCCGRIVSRANVSTVELEVTKLSDLTEIIIPLFSKYSLHAPCSARGYRDKIKDFEDFKKVAIRGTLALPRLSYADVILGHRTKLMKNKSHLTLEGIEEIKLLKSGMNKGRSSD